MTICGFYRREAAGSFCIPGNCAAKLEETIKPYGKTDASVIKWNWIPTDFLHAAVQGQKAAEKTEGNNGRGPENKGDRPHAG